MTARKGRAVVLLVVLAVVVLAVVVAIDPSLIFVALAVIYLGVQVGLLWSVTSAPAVARRARSLGRRSPDERRPDAPSLARATDALAPSEARATKRTEYGEMSTPILLLSAKAAARVAVSAALDPDKGRDPVAEVLCLHDESMHHLERTDDFPCSACVRAADAVRAAVLGARGEGGA